MMNNKTINNKKMKNKTMKNKQNKQTMGGRRYGQGMKGMTIDFCNHNETDEDNFCRKIKVENIHKIVLYVKDPTNSALKQMTLTHDETSDFFDFINKDSSVQKYIVKEFYNPIQPQQDFKNELRGYENISQILSSNENAVGMKYQSHFIIGFSLEEKPTQLSILQTEINNVLENNLFKIPEMQSNFQYFVINRRCEQPLSFDYLNKMDARTFEQFVLDILRILVKLNENNMIHSDIKPDNMMYCNGRFILIDWELSRKYTQSFFEKATLVPWPVLYILQFGKIWRTIFSILYNHYLTIFQAGDTNQPNVSSYFEKSIEYYTSMFAKLGRIKSKERVRQTMDQYNFGLVLYGILQHNRILQSSPKYASYLDFVNRIYKFENPQKAVRAFKTLVR